MARSRHASEPVDLHARLTRQRLQRFATLEAAAPRRASGWRSTAAPAPGRPTRPMPRRHGLQSPSGLHSVGADPSACTSGSLDRTMWPTSLDIGFSA